MEFRPGELVAPSNVSCFAAGRSQAVSLVRTLYQYESPDAGSVAVSHPSSAMVTQLRLRDMGDQPVATEFTSDFLFLNLRAVWLTTRVCKSTTSGTTHTLCLLRIN